MFRPLLGSLVIALFPAVSVAQPGIGSMGGGFRPASPGLAAPGFLPYRPGPGMPPNHGFGVRPFGGYYGSGGFISGTYGNYYGGYYGNYYSPYFVAPNTSYYYDPSVAPLPPPSMERTIALSNEFPARLTLEFPAAARVWLDGKEVEGDAARERTVSSPVLKPGARYTFLIRARWAVNGQEYEYTREVTLGSGDQSRLLVVAGTAVAGK